MFGKIIYYIKEPRKLYKVIFDFLFGTKIIQFFLTKYRSEKRFSLGFRNKDKTFYIIRPVGSSQGLMSILNYVLYKIKYAIENEYIPIVDYRNYPNMYLKWYELFRINSWEYYWPQPSEYSLIDVLFSRNIIICDTTAQGYLIDDDDLNMYYHSLVTSRLLPRLEIQELIAKCYDELLAGKKVIGVLGRGTDYSSIQPYRHAIVPTKEELARVVDDKLLEWNMDYIFLATEDIEIYRFFKNKYEERCITYDTYRYSSDTKGKKLAKTKEVRRNDRYTQGLNYLITIYLLSMCDSIVTSNVGGGCAAIRFNGNKYKHKYVFDLGCYGEK